MAESKSTHLFFVYAPDYTDADGVARRLSVREKHLEGAKRITQQGLLRFGGALVSPDTYDGPAKKMIGSAMVFEAESLDAVRKVIEADIYYTSGVWDKEKLMVLPWVPATPLPRIVQE